MKVIDSLVKQQKNDWARSWLQTSYMCLENADHILFYFWNWLDDDMMGRYG